jgi:DNA topoisomerase I
MAELIIAEKPDAASKIASALADSSAKKSNIKGVPYYELTHEGKKIIVGSAVGHLYTVASKVKSYKYPQFDTLWAETSKVDKKSTFSKKYVTALKQLCTQADEFTVATDFDIEGEVIGYNIIKHICKKKDANRMKFSTLTKPDLIEAYETKQNTLDWGQANAGITRHELDWYYGINLSSALMSAIKSAGTFKVLSSGRVQGPALKLLCDKEREIKAFVSEPYWQIHLDGNVHSNQIEAWHVDDKIFDQVRADAIIAKTKDQKQGIIKEKDISEFSQQPPFPFDLTTFQIECYRVHRISPKQTLSIAQDLYTAGFISYPRTSSQKLPAKLGYIKLLSALKKQPKYTALADRLLAKKSLKPNEGKKVDEAHPAIYPTGIIPGNLDPYAAKVYDLIVRRFLATFSDPAIRETVKAIIDVNTEFFVCKGTTTKVKGWHEFYGPYAVFDEITLPPMEKDDSVDISSIEKISKETKPPKRYTPASIIKELDKRNLGTKATRAQIIDSLYHRGYVNHKSMEVTDLGMKTCDILEKYSPSILDEALTRKFEEELEKIRHKEMTPAQVLTEARELLIKILSEFKSKEKQIGEALKQAQFDSKDAMTTIGPCPVCKKGTLKLRNGKYGQFVACDSYPDCKTTFSMPNNAIIKPSKNECSECKHPMVSIIRSKKAPQELCINQSCPSKKTQAEIDSPDGGKSYPEEGIQCPSCGKGQMLLRKSLYGTFLGCNKYPACKTMMKIVDGKVDKKHITYSPKKNNKSKKKSFKKKA